MVVLFEGLVEFASHVLWRPTGVCSEPDSLLAQCGSSVFMAVHPKGLNCEI